jgi:hypothetical protein
LFSFTPDPVTGGKFGVPDWRLCGLDPAGLLGAVARGLLLPCEGADAWIVGTADANVTRNKRDSTTKVVRLPTSSQVLKYLPILNMYTQLNASSRKLEMHCERLPFQINMQVGQDSGGIKKGPTFWVGRSDVSEVGRSPGELILNCITAVFQKPGPLCSRSDHNSCAFSEMS